MAKATRISIETSKGGNSYGLCWVEDNRKSIANVVIITGMEETSSRYDEFAQYLKITNPIFFIFYFLVMPIFMLMLAHRFNKKLFKFSINKTIKEVF